MTCVAMDDGAPSAKRGMTNRAYRAQAPLTLGRAIARPRTGREIRSDAMRLMAAICKYVYTPAGKGLAREPSQRTFSA